MGKAWQRLLDADDLCFWIRWLDDVGDERIAWMDWQESHRRREVAEFGLSSLPRIEQARILRALELNLRPRETVDRNAPGPYSLKHDAENYIMLTEGRPCYVSELQARTCMRIMGYRHTDCKPYRYNVSMLSYNQWRRNMDAMKRAR